MASNARGTHGTGGSSSSDEGKGKGCVKYLTCYYWYMSECKKPDAECAYSHWWTGILASQPRPLRPGGPSVAGRNAAMAMREISRNWRQPASTSSLSPSPTASSEHAPPVSRSLQMIQDARARSVSPFTLPAALHQSGNSARGLNLPRVAAHNHAGLQFYNHNIESGRGYQSANPAPAQTTRQESTQSPSVASTIRPRSTHTRRLTVGAGRPGKGNTMSDPVARSAAILTQGLDSTLASLRELLVEIYTTEVFESATLGDIRKLQQKLNHIHGEGLRVRRSATAELEGEGWRLTS